MSTLFILMFLASVVALIVGVARPPLIRLGSRWHAALIFGTSAFISLIVVWVTAPPRPVEQVSTTASATNIPAKAPVVVAINSADAQRAQIEQRIRAIPMNSTYLGTGTITKVDVYQVPDFNNASTTAWNAEVDLKIEGSRAVMNEEVAEIYYTLFANRKDIMIARVSVYESVTDKYGNQKDLEIYNSFLKTDEASKVNWSLDHDSLVYSVLPKLWTVNLDLTVSNPSLLNK